MPPAEPPLVSGVASPGLPLTCEPGVWSGAPPPSFSYQWYRDGAEIAGATSDIYTVEPADEGHRLSCVVVGANSLGSVEVESDHVAVAARSVVQLPGNEVVVLGQAPKVTSTEANNALVSQLGRALGAIHISALMSKGSVSFSFASPGAGTVEVQIYEVVKSGHSTKHEVIASGTIAFTKSASAGLRLRLTSEGRRLLKHKQRVKVDAKGVFMSTSGALLATWSDPFTLRH